MSESLKENEMFKSLYEIAKEVKQTMRCNCDLDNWQPNNDSGHSDVCQIDKAARRLFAQERQRARATLNGYTG